MKMKKKLTWRLNGPLPTVEEVFKMVELKILNREEAREILFNEDLPEKTK